MSSGLIRVDLSDCANAVLKMEDVVKLVGYPIVLEGGIAQGKTCLAHAIASLLRSYGFDAVCCPEPTDKEALAVFMKVPAGFGAPADCRMQYQAEPPTDPAELAAFVENRKKAAARMQSSMMRRRAQIVKEAAKLARKGTIPIVDRGPIGDACFMASTFRKYDVPVIEEGAYIGEFLGTYMSIPFPKGRFLVLRVKAPVSVTHARYMRREEHVAGNKYLPAYLQGIEDAHDACLGRFGPHVVYDNTTVPYVRPASPVDERGEEMHGTPDANAIKCVVNALAKLAGVTAAAVAADV